MINEERLLQAHDQLNELQGAIEFLHGKSKYELFAKQEEKILNLLAIYSKTFTVA
ncbi:MAG: hypothetical protein V1872_04650 [bacterium]